MTFSSSLVRAFATTHAPFDAHVHLQTPSYFLCYILNAFVVAHSLSFVTGACSSDVPKNEQLARCLRDVVPAIRWDNDTRTWADSLGNETSPLAVVYPTVADDVVGVLSCADMLNVTYNVVSGRHFYQVIADMDGAILIDVHDMCTEESISVDLERQIITVAAGCPNGSVLGAMPEGYVFPVGNCPTVGLGGFILGGGISDVSRYAGLGCDTLQSLSIVEKRDGVVSLQTTSDPEVLYTACGGGVGPESQLRGVVTSFTLQLVPSPADVFTRITALVARDATPDALVALQDMLRSDDARYFRFGGGGVIGVLHEYDIGLVLNLLYLGSAVEARGLLEEAGVIDDAWSSTIVDEYLSFKDAMSISMVQDGIGTNMSVACGIFGCDRFTGMVLPSAASSITEMLHDLDSPLLDKHSDMWQTRQFAYPVPGFMTKGMDRVAWEHVTDVAMSPALGDDGKPLCERHYALLAHLTGGQVKLRDASKAAFPWREETVLLTWLNGMDPSQHQACIAEAQRYQSALEADGVRLDRAYANYRGADDVDVAYAKAQPKP